MKQYENSLLGAWWRIIIAAFFKNGAYFVWLIKKKYQYQLSRVVDVDISLIEVLN
jgi:hypothetical protein